MSLHADDLVSVSLTVGRESWLRQRHPHDVHGSDHGLRLRQPDPGIYSLGDALPEAWPAGREGTERQNAEDDFHDFTPYG